jgi:1-acyl-sn-glycerol-3-phosphate acyltransferase
LHQIFECEKMSIIFCKLYDFFQNKRPLLFSILLILIAFLGWHTSQIHFNSNINDMIPQDERIISLNNYLQRTSSGEQLFISIESEDSIEADALIEYQEILATLIDSAASSYIDEIVTSPAAIDEWTMYNMSSSNLPFLLTDSDYTAITQRLAPDAIAAFVKKQKELLQTPAGSFIAQTLPEDPLGLNFLGLEKFKKLNASDRYNIYNNYIFTHDFKKLIFFIKPKYASSNTKANGALLGILEDTRQNFEAQYSPIKIMYFGGALVAAANASQMQQDTIATLSITIIALLAFTWYIFKRKRTGLLLVMPVLFGILLSLGCINIIQGTLGVLALGVGAIILGIALDFSIHYLNHARENTTTREDIAALANPLSLGAFTTIAAFFILKYAHSSVLNDLGIFASLALLGASLFSLIFLPHLVDVLGIKKRKEYVKPTFVDKIAQWKPEKNKWIVIAIFLLTPILYFFSDKVVFNGDLLALNYMTAPLQKAEKSFQNDAQQSLKTIYIIAKNEDNNIALAASNETNPLLEQLQKDKKIVSYIQPGNFILSDTESQKLYAKWLAFWNKYDLNTIQAYINQAYSTHGFDISMLQNIKNFVASKSPAQTEEDVQLLKTLMPINISKYGDTTAYITTIKVTNEHRNEVMLALQQLPHIITVDNQSVMEQLVAYINIDFNNLVFYSGLLVFLALLVVYGRFELAIISFLPMAISWIWILGIMGLFGLEFNIVNIIICTLIFGLGDDYSIFMMDGLLEKYKTGKEKLLVSRAAIYVSAITTIIGLGVLIFAKHPALKSIAAIAVIGIGCVVIISQVLQPLLFNFFIQKRADKGLMPFTLWSFIKSIFAFTYFLVGCLILTILGIILTVLKPLGRTRSKLVFHNILSKYTKSVLYVMTNTKKYFHYTNSRYFEKPAIYIANHTSFLDILITIGLHPKVILITADWVWNSPIMGKIVRMADFYPATEGAEAGISTLSKMRDLGYSIVIFPEGTRSTTDKMLKFRKGAFYLAQQLQMDIIPIILHGVSNTMEKNDFLLKDGTMHIHVMDPININDGSWGRSITEIRKNVSNWFKIQYLSLKEQYETPQYFRETLTKSHIYKGAVLEWYCRIKTHLEGNYEHYHNMLPREGKFYDLGCGYGFMTMMLHWASPSRRFVGIDYDEEKVATAQNHYYFKSKRYLQLYKPDSTAIFDKGLYFCTENLTQIQLEPCNGILLMDALHYLLPAQQQQLLQTCYDAILPGGILILRDGVKEEAEKHAVTKTTELFSTQLLKFNKTQNELHFISKAAILQFFEQQGATVRTHNYSKTLSNVTFCIQKPF